MDYIDNFKSILDEAVRGLEDVIYINMLMQSVEGADEDVQKVMKAFFSAMIRHGVSGKVIFEVLMDVGKEWKKDE